MAPRRYRPKVRLGVDKFLEEYSGKFLGRRIGLIVNQGSVTSGLEHTIEAFLRMGLHITAIFAPEHGLRGEKQAGERWETFLYEGTDIPVYSLYGETRKPSPEMLENVDVLIWDIPEIGARYSTYIATMVYAMEACAEENKSFLVLDRPNPISGRQEGHILDDEFRSFVGILPIPMRHGLTPGELALFAKDVNSLDLELMVIPMEGWKRRMFYDDTGLLWINPSPNLPCLENVWLYPGACLLEGTNISEGRGTTLPFKVLGAPWIDGGILSAELNANSEGVFFREVGFTPTFSKYQGELCNGVAVHILEPDMDIIALYLFILQTIKVLYPDKFQWIRRDEGYVIDYLVGSEVVRRTIDEMGSLASVLVEWEEELESFEERIIPYILYAL